MLVYRRMVIHILCGNEFMCIKTTAKQFGNLCNKLEQEASNPSELALWEISLLDVTTKNEGHFPERGGALASPAMFQEEKMKW